ncbi:MAG: hypothetical protein LBB81_11745 [Treponema sp.]|jgi:hypothetical protein|nr:hypothetical protein [Treponema sp.]
MRSVKKYVFGLVFFILSVSLYAQNFSSVPLESNIYYILEQAQIKGLCQPLSGIKPYSRSVINKAINEILTSDKTGKLNAAEIEILKQYASSFSKPAKGLDLQRGSWYGETVFSKKDFPISLQIGTNVLTEGSTGLYPLSREAYAGAELWLRFYLNGDIAHNYSWEFSGEGGLMYVPRKKLGLYNTYYEGFSEINDNEREYFNRVIEVYSQPLTHFPYSYRKRWDASVHYFSDLSGFNYWPDPLAGAYNLISELDASYLDDIITFRIGRITREWGSTPLGSSLHLNQAARPFVAFEGEFRPFSWFGISTMTGILEFENLEGEKTSAINDQRAYSISMLQLRYKDYLFLDLGEAVVWPKRFELGYISPITNTIFYKNNIGDFDNLSAMVNIKAQYPGIGNVWASLFWDEAFWVSNFFELDRTMLAWQTGIEVSLPILSFSSLRVSYTKLNPYCYTHTRVLTPWYGELSMQESYTNNGVSLGYYTPPNSEELLVRFSTMPVKNLKAHFQYQMIIHGADYGSSAVDGSSLFSELDPDGRDGSRPVLKRYFLRDGAYQWNHVFRIGGEWTLPKAPVAFFSELGMVMSYFTNTGVKANDGSPQPYSVIDTAEYPKSAGFIWVIGVKLYPR